jgi:hypothetical protein
MFRRRRRRIGGSRRLSAPRAATGRPLVERPPTNDLLEREWLSWRQAMIDARPNAVSAGRSDAESDRAVGEMSNVSGVEDSAVALVRGVAICAAFVRSLYDLISGRTKATGFAECARDIWPGTFGSPGARRHGSLTIPPIFVRELRERCASTEA